jgi:hypothetical protein
LSKIKFRGATYSSYVYYKKPLDYRLLSYSPTLFFLNNKKEAEKTKLILQIKNKEEILKQSNVTGGNKNLNLDQTELKKLKNELITLEQITNNAKAGTSYFYLTNFGIDVQYPILTI